MRLQSEPNTLKSHHMPPLQPLQISAPHHDLTSLKCHKPGHSPGGCEPSSTGFISKGMGLRKMSLSLDFFDFFKSRGTLGLQSTQLPPSPFM